MTYFVTYHVLYILENVPCMLEKNVYSASVGGVSISFMVLFRSHTPY